MHRLLLLKVRTGLPAGGSGSCSAGRYRRQP
nr:MAG TPA: hypothetical protein [Caudoviricetes sp.]